MDNHKSSSNSGPTLSHRSKTAGNSAAKSKQQQQQTHHDQDKQDELQQQQLARYKFSELPASYFICLIIRFLVGISSTGYIHPDEYFQSPEITSTSIFNIKTFIPWEFDPLNPCRSIVIPILNTGIPFTVLSNLQNLLRYLGYQGSIVNGYTLLIFPRFFAVCSSFLLDYYTILICKKFNLSISKALSVLSSCWLIIIFHSRTFSNTTESLAVATLLTVVVLYDVPKRSSPRRLPTVSWKDFLIGGLVAFGLFARFTFLFFAAPIGIYFVYHLYCKLHLFKFIVKVVTIATGFIVSTVVFVILDSLYFGYLHANIKQYDNPLDMFTTLYTPSSVDDNQIYHTNSPFISFNGSMTFTPMNSLLYNLDPKNLALHGIHNRLTHLFVNFPMMVGPLAIILILEVIQVGTALFSTSNHHNYHHHKSNSHQNQSNNNTPADTLPLKTRALMLSVIVFGLFLLSMAPHQEARFLLPLFFPLAILSYRYFYLPSLSSKCLAMSWILFNMCITIFFGFLHQGGVVPSLVYLQKHLVANNDLSSLTHSVLHSQAQQHPLDQPVSIIYYKTYMPPEHLMTIPLNSTRSINILDPRGDIDSLTKIMDSITNQEILILSPLKNILYQQYKGKTCQLIESFWPHLSTENPPDTIDEMRLYLFSCYDWSE